MGPPSLDRVLAAVEHARVLIFRAEPRAVVDRDLEHLAALGAEDDGLRDAYVTAIELLASVPYDTLEEMAAAYRRRA